MPRTSLPSIECKWGDTVGAGGAAQGGGTRRCLPQSPAARGRELCRRSGAAPEHPWLRWWEAVGSCLTLAPLQGPLSSGDTPEQLLTISCCLVSPPQSPAEALQCGQGGELFAAGRGALGEQLVSAGGGSTGWRVGMRSVGLRQRRLRRVLGICCQPRQGPAELASHAHSLALAA